MNAEIEFKKLMEDLELRGYVKIEGERVLVSKRFRKLFCKALIDRQIFGRAITLYKLFTKPLAKKLSEAEKILSFITIIFTLMVWKEGFKYISEEEVDRYLTRPFSTGYVVGTLLGLIETKDVRNYVKVEDRNGLIRVCAPFYRLWKEVERIW